MMTIAQALTLAQRHHQAGDLDRAEAIYRQIVQADPNQQDVLLLLGSALASRGQLDEAVACFRELLRINPQCASAYNNVGQALLEQGRLDEAVACLHLALRINPNIPEAHNNLGNALLAQGRPDEAAVCYRQALQINPRYANAHYNLANVLMDQGDFDQAVAIYKQALQINPHSAKTHNNLGTALKQQGRLVEAVAHYQEALRIHPDMAEAHHNLGDALARLGRYSEAAASFRHALRIKPDSAKTYHELGMVLANQDAVDEAIACFQNAARLDPDFSETSCVLGVLLSDQAGKIDEALACVEQALRHRPTDRLRVVLATRLPIIYQSTAEVHWWRKRLLQGIRQLREDQVVLDLAKETALNLFYPPYQGFDDCALQREAARLYRAPLEREEGGEMRDEGKPGLHPPSSLIPHPSSLKIRVGFISSFLRDHTIGHLNRGLVAQLSRDRFAVTVLSLGSHHNAGADFFKQHADRYLEVPRDPATAPRLIAEQNLDVLFYTDIGMDPVTSTLAFSRLAPVQCVTWGHPVTTGIDTIDYFISAEDLETAESDQHYTERLIRLKDMPIYYYRPDLPMPLKDRRHFGFGDEDHIYACPQSLFKFHPAFDEVLGGILRGDPRGTLVLIKSKHPHWELLLRRRFAATLPDVIDRICFLPQQDRGDFINLMAISDVLLDPLHFGGGNTSYEAFAVGTPIVTMPSRFLRGRITYALYKQMKVLDCVAENPQEYIKLALRLGMDAGFRHTVSQKIKYASPVLYENSKGIRELEHFFHQVAASKGLPIQEPQSRCSV